MWYDLLRPLLFSFDAELVHNLTFSSLRVAQRFAERLPGPARAPDPMLQQHLWGLSFANPIGLAAGLDKNAELPHVWPRLGFGHAELGTITAHAQPGNPRPRLFRLEADRALINRMGFNNRGAETIATALQARARRPPIGIPIGLNIGKTARTPIEDAARDYQLSFRLLAPYADYVAINVSSPNTPGLRSLQSQRRLAELLEAIEEEQAAREARGAARRPLLVKLAPDLSEDDFQSIVDVALDHKVAGLIATNTTVERPNLRTPSPLASETGGLSGAPLASRSTAVIRTLHRCSAGRLPIIGVGGVFNADDAYEKLRAGASLVQIYSGFIYNGPGFPRDLCRGLRALLERDGLDNISQAIGRDA